MSGEAKRKPKFPLGRVVATPGALAALEEVGGDVRILLDRHSSLDRGALSLADHRSNEMALEDGSRILSSYVVEGVKFWVITEARNDDGGRASSCVLLPADY